MDTSNNKDEDTRLKQEALEVLQRGFREKLKELEAEQNAILQEAKNSQKYE